MNVYRNITLAEAVARYDMGGCAALTDSELLQIALSLDEKESEGAAEALLSGESESPMDDESGKKMSALQEILRRFSRRGKPIQCPEDIYRKLSHYAIGAQQEMLIIMSLDGAHVPISTTVVSVGLLNKTIVHPREVFAKAIEERACTIVMAHNHPSGALIPSEDDKDVTVRIKKAGDLLGVKLLDHLIITEDSYYSFLEHGLM